MNTVFFLYSEISRNESCNVKWLLKLSLFFSCLVHIAMFMFKFITVIAARHLCSPQNPI